MAEERAIPPEWKFPFVQPTMELRDWFAGQALTVLGDETQQGVPSNTAEYCYRIADAMMAERERRRDNGVG